MNTSKQNIEVSKEEILDSIVKDWTTPITRQDCYEAMDKWYAQHQSNTSESKNEPEKSDIEDLRNRFSEWYIKKESQNPPLAMQIFYWFENNIKSLNATSEPIKIFNVLDNCDAFRDWLKENNIPYLSNGAFTCFDLNQDIFSIGKKFGVYEYLNKPVVNESAEPIKDKELLSVEKLFPVVEKICNEYYSGDQMSDMVKKCWILQEFIQSILAKQYAASQANNSK